MATKGFIPGLEGVVAAETRVSDVNGEAGELTVAGFPLEAFADRATFEEALHLVWRDRLPTQGELAELSDGLKMHRALPDAARRVVEAAAREQAHPMDALRMAAATLSLGRGESGSPERDAAALVAGFPTIVASYWRLLNDESIVEPDPDLGHAANYLYMLTGEKPSPARVRGLETYLNTVIDHGLNASTFTARVIVSTQSDFVSAVTGAIGALKGPLHGGAPGPALDMVFEIGSIENAEPYLREKLGRGERLMGFGHRVYKVRDPRADVLSKAAAQMFEQDGDTKLYDLAVQVEKTAIALLEEYKPGRRLKTNVEYYTAMLLHGLDLPTELFTPTFAVGRVGGWTAHCFEQQAANRLIRPQSTYVGVRGREWVPLDARG